MPHKILAEPLSPGVSKSASNIFDSDSLKVRRTSTSLGGLSPGSRLAHSKSISIQDLVGGEKKATDIHSKSFGTSKSSLLSVESAPSVVHAEDKIQNILQARKTRQRRRSDITKSLDISTMLLVTNSPKLSNSASFSDVSDDQENLTIPLNDVDYVPEGTDREARRRRRRSSGGGSKGISPSRRMSDASRDQRRRMIKNLESQNSEKGPKSLTKVSAFSPKSPGMRRSTSANSLKERLRQRLQGVNYCDLNDSDTSDTEECTTTKRSKGTFINDNGSGELTVDGSDAGIENHDKARTRSKSKQRPRSKSRNRISKKQTESLDGAETLKKPSSRSKSQVRSKSKTRRRFRKEDTETEDETSTASKSTANSNLLSDRRGSRCPSLLAGDPAVFSDDNTDEGESCELRPTMNISYTVESPSTRSGRKVVSRNLGIKEKSLDTSNSSTECQLVSPGSKKSKKRTKNKKNAAQNIGEREPSLGFLLDSERSLKRSTDHDYLSQVTEEQSMAPSQGQQILLQFDPTNKNHVRSVDQDKAKKSSEIIQGMHGTKSTLEISELAGLPTFEMPNKKSSIPSRSYSLDHNPAPFLGRGSMSSMPLPGEDSIEDGGHNAQWDYGGSHSSRQNRSIASIRKNIFFNKKGKVDGEKHHKPARRSSDLGARSNSFGAMMRLGGRHKFRDYQGGFGDDESLLKH